MAIGLIGCGNMSGTGYISPDNITDDGSVNLPQNNNIVDDGTTDDGIVDDGPTYDPNYPSVENPDKTGTVPVMDDGLYQVDKVRISDTGGTGKIYYSGSDTGGTGRR